ncbi:hexose kinase [Microbacterium awajiense]|uniref:Hexose kinase n=1 Tax=Microbacterium awajiense TaxID=415214 RepID=A0ABP7A8Q8_9MICO
MIVTLTANPSLDRAILLEEPLRPGQVQAASSSREDPGGKGINVARVAAMAGIDTLAVLPLADGDPFDAALRATGLPARRVSITGHVRANLTITDPAGTTTKLNLPGAALRVTDRSALIAAVVAASEGAAWLALAGSLPPGAGDDFYVDVIVAVRAALGDAAPRIAVDTSGAALTAVVAHAHPDLIKPNDEELADLAGRDLAPDASYDEILRIAREVVPTRVSTALVTLGARGALLVDADGAWLGTPPPITVASTVGAGDSSLAGYLLASLDHAGPAARLENAIRYGSAAAALAGTQPPRPHDLPTGDVAIETLT